MLGSPSWGHFLPLNCLRGPSVSIWDSTWRCGKENKGADKKRPLNISSFTSRPTFVSGSSWVVTGPSALRTVSPDFPGPQVFCSELPFSEVSVTIHSLVPGSWAWILSCMSRIKVSQAGVGSSTAQAPGSLSEVQGVTKTVSRTQVPSHCEVILSLPSPCLFIGTNPERETSWTFPLLHQTIFPGSPSLPVAGKSTTETE